MSDRTCETCGKVFEKPAFLRRHNNKRKKKCALPADGKNQCDKCGKEFSSKKTLAVHMKGVCKGQVVTSLGVHAITEKLIAEHSEGFSTQIELQKRMLMEHMAAQNAKIDGLAAALNKTAAAPPPEIKAMTPDVKDAPVKPAPAEVKDPPPCLAWNGPEIRGLLRTVSPALLNKITREDHSAREYCSREFNPHSRVKPEAIPYTVAMLFAIIVDHHKNPRFHNIVLHPKIKNCVLVCVEDEKGGRFWEPRTLGGAVEDLFNEVAEGVATLQKEQEKKIEDAHATGWIPVVYWWFRDMCRKTGAPLLAKFISEYTLPPGASVRETALVMAKVDASAQAPEPAPPASNAERNWDRLITSDLISYIFTESEKMNKNPLEKPDKTSVIYFVHRLADKCGCKMPTTDFISSIRRKMWEACQTFDEDENGEVTALLTNRQKYLARGFDAEMNKDAKMIVELVRQMRKKIQTQQMVNLETARKASKTTGK